MNEHRGRRKRIQFSKIYTFQCGRSSLKEDHSQQGISRVVLANISDGNQNYCDNYVRTSKYTIATFFPKSLFEQFRRVANFYFLVTGIISFTPLAPYSAIGAVFPLFVVIGATMIKEAVEDWRRAQQDNEVNSRKVKIHEKNGEFIDVEWKHIRVGDVVKVQKDEFFPADLLLISSSYEDGICYVETMTLDGETNLKVKQSLESTLHLQEDSNFEDFEAVVKCEDPNANLYSFIGTMEFQDNPYALSPLHLLLRDSKLRNTDYIYGVVLFTGHDTKVFQNSTEAPSKRSRIERKMDVIIFMMFGIMFLMGLTGSVFFGFLTADDVGMKRWYLKPDESSVYFDPKRPVVASILHFLTAVVLYSYFIPISLYVSVEVVKVLQCVFINQDVKMYYEDDDKPARARTSNLNEELGQVDTILSDKTGTLTCNSMEFIKCSIAGTAYGSSVTDVEKAMESEHAASSPLVKMKPSVKGFNFMDDRITNGMWVNEPNADSIRKFFQLLAICHTAVPDVDEDSGEVTYEAESPDEAAFVVAAREIGFEFCKRTQSTVSIREIDPVSGNTVERVYKVLNVLEFNSGRKRMSVIVSDEEGKLLLFCKGADSVMLERLSGCPFKEQTMDHVNAYADAGLRTLILAYRRLTEDAYAAFEKEFTLAKNSVTEDRETLVSHVADGIERDLILLGATAVEDKLQTGVPECIDKLSQAGIKIWILTGDKMETAINIGFACSLLRQGMKQIVIHLSNPQVKSLDKAEDKATLDKDSKDSVRSQISRGNMELKNATAAFALIIDGKSLSYALQDDLKTSFLELATACASVICCRSSPKQKALVARLVKEGRKKTTLAIGDGANDVGMLQEADIGVGISGLEGMQAVMSSDIAIAQFRYLERLLLVHGHWCYRRITSMVCYFFYKNITFGFTLFLYEACTSFSGQTAYNDWFMSLYNVLFTSLPVVAVGVFDQDVSAQSCRQFPLLYQEGVQNALFGWRRIIGWMLNGFGQAIIIFFVCVSLVGPQAFNRDGPTAGRDILGATAYTSIIFVVNLQLALSISYFTLVHHVLIWGSVALWFVFLVAYGALPGDISGDAEWLFAEALAPSPLFWASAALLVVSALSPYFAFASLQMQLFPMYHQTVQWLRHRGHTRDPAYVRMVRQRSIRRTTVGFTARRAASAGLSRIASDCV